MTSRATPERFFGHGQEEHSQRESCRGAEASKVVKKLFMFFESVFATNVQNPGVIAPFRSVVVRANQKLGAISQEQV
jgi:hypothetical protein